MFGVKIQILKNYSTFSISGNFSQLIWKDTKEVGVGTSHTNEGNDKKAVFVCLYYPAGNVMKEFTKNVPKPN